MVPRAGPGYSAGGGLGSQAVLFSNLQAQEPADDELFVETVGRLGAGKRTPVTRDLAMVDISGHFKAPGLPKSTRPLKEKL